MKIEKLGLQHKELLVGKIKALQTKISEYSFANLWLFRDVHNYEVVIDKEIFIKGRTYDGHISLMPIFDTSTVSKEYLQEIMASVDILFPVPEAQAKALSLMGFSTSFIDCDSDYLFLTEKLAEFVGAKLHNKRNLLKQFYSAHTYEILPLTNDRLNDAKAVLDMWQNDSEMAAKDTDYTPCKEAIERCEELVLCGYVYYVENEPSGFILGEELDEETFTLHFSKAKKQVKGLYQYMISAFAKATLSKYKYLNFEQDMCNLALRHSKTSYYPDVVLKKFRISA